MRIDVLADVKTHLGEGPLWDVEDERLYWLDSTGANIFRATADGREIRAWDLPQPIGSMALRKAGGAVLALADGFHFYDFTTGDLEPIADPESDRPETRLNDGKVDRQGRFLAGSMHVPEQSAEGALYRLDPDLRVGVVDRGFIVSNGPCFSPAGDRLYFADSWAGEIWCYDYDTETGTASNRRTFATVDRGDGGGLPDGSTVDSEGFLWNAQVFAGRIVRYAPDGSVDRVIQMPVKKVTSVMFGGPDLDILYATSMSKRFLPHFPADPIQRGSLFAIHGLGVRGLPEPRFGG